MKNEEKKRFGKIILSLGELWEKQIDSGLITLYFKLLKKYTIEEIENAGYNIMQNEVYFPKPATFKQYIEQDNDSAAIIAWEGVMNTISAGGPYTTSTMNDQVCAATIRAIGGWDRLLKMSNFERQSIQRNFVKLYTSFRKAGGYNSFLPSTPKQQKQLSAAKSDDIKPKIHTVRERMNKLVERLNLSDSEKRQAESRMAKQSSAKAPMTQEEFEQKKRDALEALKKYNGGGN